MHVYRNRRYEEEIVIWHKKGEQRMMETHEQKTRIQAHHKITDSATQTQTHRNKQIGGRGHVNYTSQLSLSYTFFGDDE
jgi:hypothetical protein